MYTGHGATQRRSRISEGRLATPAGVALSPTLTFAPPPSLADLAQLYTTISGVTVNGGSDSANSGTTCLRVTATLPVACNGFVAISNNKLLIIGAAMQTETTSAPIWLYSCWG
jgi:hypothetical protein